MSARVAAGRLVLGALLLAGCAYSFRGDLPAHLVRVRVPVARNETLLRRLGEDVTGAVVYRIGTDGRLRVAVTDADCRLEIRLVEYRRGVVREDRLDDPVEEQITLVAEVTFVDLATGRELISRRRVTNRETDEVSGLYRKRRGEFEQLGRRQAIEDLARNVVRAVTELWIDK